MRADRPSWQHQAFVVLITLARIKRTNNAPAVARTAERRIAGELPPAPDPKSSARVSVEASESQGMIVWTLRPTGQGVRTGRIIVAIHGGGYISEVTGLHYSAYADLAARTGAEVHVPLYPLAPLGTASTVVPAMADYLANLIAHSDAQAVAVTGESAGAGLALAAVQELVRRGSTAPARLVLVSPWLDVTLSDPRSRQIDDPILDVEGLVASGALWAGDLDATDPRVSPIYGDLAGLPPIQVWAGTRDCLMPDTWRLQERAAAEGREITFHIQRDVMHGGMGIPFLPEYRRSREQRGRQLVGD